MIYLVTMPPLTVDAETPEEARREAMQAVAESPDLLRVATFRDRAAELYARAQIEQGHR